MRTLILPSLLLLALVSPGCALDERPADFRWLNVEPESIDPGRTSDQPGGRIALNLFEGLTVRDPRTLEPWPGMAERWDVEDGGRRYVFHLRDTRWSDGTPLTAHDFAWSWTRVLDPATGARYANLLFNVVGARAFNSGEVDDPATLGLSAPDDSTFVVQLDSPLPYFLDLCAFYSLLPVPRHVVEAHGDAWVRPGNIVSNGAWLMADWQIHRRIRLVKNPRYWNAGAVELEVVDALPGDYINGNFNRYESGLLDWVDSSGIPLPIVDELERRDDWHVAPFLGTYFYRFNNTRPPLDDPRVRRALYHAVDPGPICERVLRAGQEPATSLVPPGLPNYEPVRMGGHDPALARALLAEAGYPGGEGMRSLTLLINTSEAHKQVAEVIQQQWKQVLGLEVEIRNQEWKVFQATVQSLDYDIARGGWIGDYLDPSTFLDIWHSGSGNNRTGFASARYDSMLALASRTIDVPARMALLQRCERLSMVEQQVALPIYFYVVTNLYDDTVWGGLEPNLVNHVDLKHVFRRQPGAAR